MTYNEHGLGEGDKVPMNRRSSFVLLFLFSYGHSRSGETRLFSSDHRCNLPWRNGTHIREQLSSLGLENDHKFVLIKSHMTRYVAFVMTLISCLFPFFVSSFNLYFAFKYEEGHPKLWVGISNANHVKLLIGDCNTFLGASFYI